MIQSLKNPKDQLYIEAKTNILSHNFPWYWYESSIVGDSYDKQKYSNIPFYSHTFLIRPEENDFKYPETFSPHTKIIAKILADILQYNNIKITSFLRINANCIHGSDRSVNTIPHYDHYCYHKNMIVYLTGIGGKIVVNGESHDPKEDDVIIFDGLEHYIQTPVLNGRRVCLVATFF